MKTIMQWAFFCAASLALTFLPHHAAAQTTPAIQGTFLADPAVPVLIAPAPSGSGFFVLNQDFSLLQHSTVDTSQNENCSTGPGIFSRTNPAARTLVSDLYNAYFSGPDGPGLNTAVDALAPEVSCTPVTAFDYTGGLATQSVAANDPQHALYYLVSAFGGSQVDQLLVLSNLNNVTVSTTNKFTELNEAALDTGGVYTSIVADTRSDFGLTAITELKTATSPGNLFVYYPQNNTVYKILGPGGVPLPAVTSFIIPPQTDGGGSLLVLVNQDGLTATNYLSPPQDTTPFTIIDLGQLRPIFATNPAHNTITLPFVTQIRATTSFYAMLGAAYNPIDHRIYALVAGGTSLANVVENVISYDTLNPSAPGETVVADVSNITSSLGSYPQIALNAASGTMQILTSSPAMVYTVGINGTGNSAVALTGSAFSDSNFSPTFIAANPLQGETYIASSSGQVDILTRPTTKQGGLTITLTGSDLGYTSQEYDLKALALWPVYDSSLGTAKLTITVTPKGGTPVVLATGHVADIGYPGNSFYTYMFPTAGQYTIVATAEASANYPAVTSPPLNVFVGNTGVYPTAISLSVPATVAATNGAATLNATVNLTGTTYAPLNAVYIQDQTGAEVGNVQLPKGVISNPITIPITIGEGVQTLTATYAGDEQNQSSTSTPQVITVGTVTKVTPTFAVTLPGTAVTGASVIGNLQFTSTSTTTPTGTVTIYATLAGSTTANQIATVPAAQAFASAGASFSFTAPAAGTYSVFAGYGGDTNYNNAISPHVSFTVTGAPLQTTSVGLVAPATGTPGTAFNVVVGFNVLGAFTTQPTGNIVLTATSAGATTTVGTVTPTQGMAPGGASVSVNLPNAGVYTLNANYSGDSLFAASANTATVTLNGFPTALAFSTPAGLTVGQSFNAKLTLTTSASTTATASGNVIITATPANGTTPVVITVSAAKAFATGGFSFPVTLDQSGPYAVSAVYAGGGSFSGSTTTGAFTVASAPSTLTLTGPASGQTNAALTYVVTLAGTAGATGNVTLSSTLNGNAGPSTTVPIAQATASGGATASLTFTSAGPYTVTASYVGDNNNLAALSSPLAANISASTLPTSIHLTPPNYTPSPGATFPEVVVLTATGTSTSPITGNVVLTADNVPSRGATPLQLGTVSAAAAYASGGTSCTCQFPAGSNGDYTVTATYAGDKNYAASTATAGQLVAGGNVNISLSGPATAVAGAAVPFALKLGSGLPDLEDTNPHLSVTSALNGVAGPQASVDYGSALNGITVSLAFPAPGTYTLIANYPGDRSNGASTSAPITVVVTAATKPSLSLVLNTVTANLQMDVLDAGLSDSTKMTLTAAGGYNTPVTLTLVPTKATKIIFTFQDAAGNTITSLTPSTAGSIVTIKASGPTATAMNLPAKQDARLAVYFAGGLLFLTLSGFSRRSARIRRGLTLFGVVMMVGLFASVLGACASPPDDQMAVTVTATPTNNTQGVAAQTTTFQVGFAFNLEQ